MVLEGVQQGVARPHKNNRRFSAQQGECIKPEKACKGWFGANHSDQGLAFRSRRCYQIFTNFSSVSFHSWYFFASIIQLLLFMRSYFVFSCVSSVFKNSLKSSSHLFLGRPTCLRVLMLLTSSGCQSKTLVVHLFFR